jgi:nucleoside-diphosphate-sugar epimerase
VQAARTRGVSGYLGDGSDRWAAVQRSDAARLVRLGLEHAPAGSVLHADAIGRELDLPVVSLNRQQADEHFEFLAHFRALLDMPASNEITRELLGWEPTGPTLIDDIEAGHYY